MLKTGYLITSDNQQISYQHYQDGHERLVIIAHGFYASKDSLLIQALAHTFLHRHDVFLFDFRGHGESSGRFCWTSREHWDLRTVLDHLAGHYVWTGLISFSLGGSIAIRVLAETGGVQSLVCVSCPSAVRKIDYHIWRLSLRDDIIYSYLTRQGRVGRGGRTGPFWLPKLDPIDVVDRLCTPVLYLHGDRDWVVKPWHSQQLYEKTRSLKARQIIRGGLHAELLMRRSGEYVREAIESWFGKMAEYPDTIEGGEIRCN